MSCYLEAQFSLCFVRFQASPGPFSPRFALPQHAFFPPSPQGNGPQAFRQPSPVTVPNGKSFSDGVVHSKPIRVCPPASTTNMPSTESRRSPQLPPYPASAAHLSYPRPQVNLPQSQSMHAGFIHRSPEIRSFPPPTSHNQQIRPAMNAPSPTNQQLPPPPLSLLRGSDDNLIDTMARNGTKSCITKAVNGQIGKKFASAEGICEEARKPEQNTGAGNQGEAADALTQKQMVSHAQFRAALSVSVHWASVRLMRFLTVISSVLFSACG